MKKFFILVTLLFLVGCGQDKDTSESVTNSSRTKTDHPTEGANNTSENQPVNLKQYFMPSKTTAYFEGQGNEYATYMTKTIWLNEEFVAVAEDNGGATTMRIYHVLSDKIILVSDELVETSIDDIVFPDEAELKNLTPIGTYLSGPLDEGITFDNWTIKKIGATLETPFKTFDDVMILEEKGDDYINRKYLVESFGEVKRETIMKTGEGEEDYTVSSVLTKVEK